MAKKKRAAIYARVSTVDKGQDPETQLRQLREYADRRGFEIVGEYIDHASGRREDRTQFKNLLADARKRQFDVLLVWSYDRFARSVHTLINAVEEFRELGVDFISYQQEIDTTTATGKLFFTIVASFAEFESSIIRERVLAGLERAKAQGKKLGRPSLSKREKERIIKTWQEVGSIKGTAKKLKRPYTSVHRVVTAFKAENDTSAGVSAKAS